MPFDLLRSLAVVLALSAASAASHSEACCLFGGGWGAWRPLTWTGYYAPSVSYYGASGGNCCGAGACGYGQCSPCSGGSCGAGGCCGTQAYYGPGCCGDACGSVSSNCCTSSTPANTEEPIPERPPASAPATDNFRSAPSGGSSIPGSSIPGSSIPSGAAPANPGTGEYGSGRDLQDQNYLNGSGDAPLFQLPRPAEPQTPGQEPAQPGGDPIYIEPLEIEQRPVVQSYRPERERVRVWSHAELPHVVARSLPAVNAPGAEIPAVASR